MALNNVVQNSKVNNEYSGEYVRQGDIAVETDRGNLPPVDLPSFGGVLPTDDSPVENDANIIMQDADTGDSFLFSSAQAAEPEVQEEPSVLKVIKPEAWNPNVTVAELDERLSTVGAEQFTKDLNRNITILANGVEQNASGVAYYDPPILDKGKSDPEGAVWHYGIPLSEWRRTVTSADPSTGLAPSEELVISRRKDLLRNRFIELGVGESVHGKNILANAEPGVLNTTDIGWNGSEFYRQPTVGERILTELESQGKATARGILYGIPEALISLNQLGGMFITSAGQAPELGFSYAASAITDAFNELKDMPEDTAINYSQRKTEEFLESLQLVGEDNERMREWLRKKSYDIGLTDLIGERLSGGTMGTRVVEEAIPYLITLAMPIAYATQLVRASKSLKIAQRLMVDRGKVNLGGIENRLTELNNKAGTVRGLSPQDKIELIALNNQTKLLRNVTDKERKYLAKWPTENYGSGYRLTQAGRSEIANTEFLLETGAAAGLSYAAAAFGEDHWVTAVAPLVGGLAAVHNTGQTIAGIGDKTLYGLRSLEFAGHRMADLSGVAGSQENMLRTAIKMFGLQSQAKERMSKKAIQQARDLYQIDGEGKLSTAQIRTKALQNNAEYEQLLKVPNRNAAQESRLVELRSNYVPLDGSNWQAELTGLDFQELSSIVSTRPKMLKKLRQSARYLIDSMEPEQRVSFSKKIQEARKNANVLEAAMKARGITDANGSATLSLYLENFIESSALGALQKELLSRNTSGLALNLSKKLKLWSRYFAIKKRQEQSIASLNRFVEDVLDPLDEQNITPDLINFKESVEKSLSFIRSEKNANDILAKRMVDGLSQKLKTLVKNKPYMDRIEKGLNLRQALSLDELAQPEHARQKIREINTETARYLSRAAKPHNELYDKLKYSSDWNVELPAGNVGAELIDLSSEFFPMINWESQAGIRPPSAKIVELVVEARRESIYKLLGGSAERLTDGRPKTFKTPENLDDLMETLLDSEFAGKRIKIMKSGSKQEKIVLTRNKWNGFQKNIDDIRNKEPADAEGNPLTGRALAAFNKSKLFAESAATANFIEDILYVPSSEIPMDIPLNILDQVRSNIGKEAHANINNRKGVRLLKIQEVLDTVGDSEFKQLDLFESAELSPKQTELLTTWREARQAYREYKQLIGQPFETEATTLGPQRSKYTYKMKEIEDASGNVDMEKASLFNSWEKVFIASDDPARTADEFAKAFTDPQLGRVPDHVLSLLLDSAGMYLNKGKKLPAGWWESYRKLFEESSIDVEKYGENVNNWESFRQEFQVAEKEGIYGLDQINTDKITKQNNEFLQEIDTISNSAKEELNKLSKVVENAEDKEILKGLEKLLKPETSETGILYNSAIEILFSRDPKFHVSRKMDAGIDHITREVENLEIMGKDWTAALGEGQLNIVNTILGRHAKAQAEGSRYVPPIEDVFRILDNAVENGAVTARQKDKTVDVLRSFFSRYVADSIKNRTEFKSWVKDGTPAETIDLSEVHDLLQNHQSTLRYLYDDDEAKLVNQALAMAFDIGGVWRELDRNTGIPSSLKMESALARMFAVSRGVVSWRWVLGEQSIRQYRMQSLKQLQYFLENPDSMRVVLNVMEKDPALITGKDVTAWKNAFVHLLPGTLAKNLTLESLKQETARYQKELNDFKQANQLPTDYKPSIGFGEAGINSTVGNIFKLRADAERTESVRRGVPPATDPTVMERRAEERLDLKQGGRLVDQMQRLMN